MNDLSHEERVELWISRILRGGVTASLLIIVVGMTVSVVHHPSYLYSPPDLQRLTAPGAAFPHSVVDVAAGLRNFRGQAIVALGLMLLIATPVVRVAVSVLVFVHERDRIFVIVTLVVLAMLLLSFVLGKVEA